MALQVKMRRTIESSFERQISTQWERANANYETHETIYRQLSMSGVVKIKHDIDITIPRRACEYNSFPQICILYCRHIGVIGVWLYCFHFSNFHRTNSAYSIQNRNSGTHAEMVLYLKTRYSWENIATMTLLDYTWCKSPLWDILWHKWK